MGHKVHPLSVRIPFLRAWESAWYSDRGYADFALQDAHVRAYVDALSRSAQVSQHRLLSHVFPKQHHLYILSHTGQSLTPRSRTGPHRRPPLAVASSWTHPVSTFVTQGGQAQAHARHLLAHMHACRRKGVRHPSPDRAPYHIDASKMRSMDWFAPASLRHEERPSRGLSSVSAKVPALHTAYTTAPLQRAMETHLSSACATSTFVFGMQTRQLFQSAESVASYIARGLEQKKKLRFLWERLLQEDKKGLQGLRIVCGGRIGGSEMAKVESRKWGQTPLHTFATKVEYSAHTAHTPFGSIGVKVWLCFA